MKWMYEVVRDIFGKLPPLFECPLCFATIQGKSVKKHTKYHEARGEHE